MSGFQRGGDRYPHPFSGIPGFPKYGDKQYVIYHKLHPIFTTVDRYLFQFKEYGGAPLENWPSPIYGAAIHYTEGQPELVVVLQGGQIPASTPDPYWMVVYGFKLYRVDIDTSLEHYEVDYESERIILNDAIKFDECRIVFDPTGTFFTAEGFHASSGVAHSLITVHLEDGVSSVPYIPLVDRPEWAAALEAGELAEWVSHSGRGMVCSDSVRLFDYEHPYDWSMYHHQIRLQYNGIEVLVDYPAGTAEYPDGYADMIAEWHDIGGPPIPFVYQDNVAEIGAVTAYSIPLALKNYVDHADDFPPSILGFHRIGGLLNPALDLFGVDDLCYILGKLSRV
jgi:hypothetical protein